tara:strand:+ start:5605 stop:5889 length:285 start_codon:yes stop_codon:yes gene_type:complete
MYGIAQHQSMGLCNGRIVAVQSFPQLKNCSEIFLIFYGGVNNPQGKPFAREPLRTGNENSLEKNPSPFNDERVSFEGREEENSSSFCFHEGKFA